MNNIKPSHSSNRVVNLEKQEAREKWHKIVVKILSWSDGLIDGGLINKANLITLEEWKTYCEHTLKNNVTYGKQKTEEAIKITEAKIKKFGGFSKK